MGRARHDAVVSGEPRGFAPSQLVAQSRSRFLGTLSSTQSQSSLLGIDFTRGLDYMTGLCLARLGSVFALAFTETPKYC